MKTYNLSNEQARNFILLKQGLIGNYKFENKEGIVNFIKQAGCIQFDPIDVCGKNAELVLQSRIKGFTKLMLFQLLYEDRMLMDYFDKNMAIFCLDDWKYFSRYREKYQLSGRSHDKVEAIAGEVKRIIEINKFICSRDLNLKEKVDWPWSPTTLSRAVLETLYFRGDLIIHHKKGTTKYYSLAVDTIDNTTLYAEDPNKTEEDFIKWQVLRRIGSIGLLWNKPSDAWLGINGLKSRYRSSIFSSLLSEGKIKECKIENISDSFYFLSSDESLVQESLSRNKFKYRIEFIAPLDNVMWDRKLINTILNFEYKWEIYTPIKQRKYGYYVLPVLFGNHFIGRIEISIDKKAKQLVVHNFWKEQGVKLDKSLNECFLRKLDQFAKFNKCESFMRADMSDVL